MRKSKYIFSLIALFPALVTAPTRLQAQDLPLTQSLQPSSLEPLDPASNVSNPVVESSLHTPLPEEYVWTASTAAVSDKLLYTFPAISEQTEPHYFRAHFHLGTLPSEATLYLAGPRSVTVYINGVLADRVTSDTTNPLGMHVFITPVAKLLRSGENTIAIEAVRGRGVTGFANSALVRQQTFGQVLVAKIVPAAPGVVAPDVFHSNQSWRSSLKTEAGWELPSFRDAVWPAVVSLGGIESNIELFQWNADAGLYNWPGYDGISPFLAHMVLPVNKVLASYAGRSTYEDLEGLTHNGAIRIHSPAEALTAAEAPSLFVDFGRELTGRLEIESATDSPIALSIQMGESESEALKSPYFGVNHITIPPHGTGHSPKTAFRYARIVFLAGSTDIKISSIHADHIYYPVHQLGSFESSDALLNRIWETGAYTAHLCMQDGVWDASKRDRGRWMGDTDVSGPVIEEVFADKTLLADTLDRLLGPDHHVPVNQHVNGIPGYSSFWFTGVADFYRHTGDKEFLKLEHERMLQLLSVVDREFDDRNLYANKSNVWLYVDWSPELNGDTPETRRATTLEFLRAYREAAYLLSEIGDDANAAKYRARADAVRVAANKYLLDTATQTFGPRWQTNAAAVISGAASSAQYEAIWAKVLSQVGTQPTRSLIISPYYNDYVLRAMAEMGHRTEALAWMRQYWGGMIGEGATSFWEAYDPSWYKEDFHSSLQADNRSGYFVSLAHGWSAGPTAWLTEEILGVKPTGPGYATVSIRPDLSGLSWAKGTVPTPRGLIHVSARKKGDSNEISIDLPPGTTASVLVPASRNTVTVNGKPAPNQPAEKGARTMLTLNISGHFDITD